MNYSLYSFTKGNLKSSKNTFSFIWIGKLVLGALRKKNKQTCICMFFFFRMVNSRTRWKRMCVGSLGMMTPWVAIIVQLGLMETGAGRPLEIRTAHSIFLFQGLQGFGIFSLCTSVQFSFLPAGFLGFSLCMECNGCSASLRTILNIFLWYLFLLPNDLKLKTFVFIMNGEYFYMV